MSGIFLVNNRNTACLPELRSFLVGIRILTDFYLLQNNSVWELVILIVKSRSLFTTCVRQYGSRKIPVLIFILSSRGTDVQDSDWSFVLLDNRQDVRNMACADIPLETFVISRKAKLVKLTIENNHANGFALKYITLNHRSNWSSML